MRVGRGVLVGVGITGDVGVGVIANVGEGVTSLVGVGETIGVSDGTGVCVGVGTPGLRYHGALVTSDLNMFNSILATLFLPLYDG